MSRSFYLKLTLLTIVFLFFIELVTVLVESVYMLDLLNLTLDEKALGMLFLLSPLLLIFLKNKLPSYTLEILVVLLFLFRILTPLVNVNLKILTAGFGVASFMLFLPIFIYPSEHNGRKSKEEPLLLGLGLSFSVLLLILFRSLNSTVDISIYNEFQIIGWVLAGFGFLLLIFRVFKQDAISDINNENVEMKQTNASKGDNIAGEKTERGKSSLKIYGLALGLIGILLLSYFAFTSPTVISRWTEGNYIAITLVLSSSIVLFIFLLLKTDFLNQTNQKVIWIWNVVFILLLFLSIFIHTVPFPSSPESAPVVVNSPSPWYFYLPLYGMLILSPVIFYDLILITRELRSLKYRLSKFGTSFTVAAIFFILMIFILIFTNVWGYVDVVSLIFRNLFWLPFLLSGAAIGIAVILIKKENLKISIPKQRFKNGLYVVILSMVLFGGIIIGLFISTPFPSSTDEDTPNTLTIFTYNIQQGVNVSGTKNYDNQLNIIKEINPDIIGLQECDTARISGGNSDVVRYFQNKLSTDGNYYYSYYGPKTVTGTYGTAILSKYPILNAKVFFTYSDVDEIGTTEVDLQIGSKECTVYVNHPAGGHEAKLDHVETLKERAQDKEDVIALGDFNFRQDSAYYNKVVSFLDDAWLEKWPNATDENGLNMTDRIDHIFISADFSVKKTRFIIDPQSDHPALWAQVEWN